MITRAAAILSLLSLAACSARPTPVFMFRGGFECGHMYRCRARGLPGDGTAAATLVFKQSSPSRCTVGGARVDPDHVIRASNGDVVGQLHSPNVPAPDTVAWTCVRMD